MQSSDGTTCGLDQATIARLTCVTESNVCTLVERMQRDGLLIRTIDRHDRRKRLLRLSDEGRRVLLDANQLLRQQMASLCSTAHDAHACVAELRRLVDGLADQGNPAVDSFLSPHIPAATSPPSPSAEKHRSQHS